MSIKQDKIRGFTWLNSTQLNSSQEPKVMVVTDMTKHGAIDEAEICECQLIEQTV